MSITTLQDIVYPALQFMTFVMAGLLLLTYMRLDQRYAILALAIYFLVQSSIFVFLALALGNNPHIDHSLFQVLVIYGRIVLLIVLGVCVCLQACRLWYRR